jgi:hypothetical protein
MSPELIALSISLWAWFIAVLIAPHFKDQVGPSSFLGRTFDGLSRLLERGWNSVARRSRG